MRDRLTINSLRIVAPHFSMTQSTEEKMAIVLHCSSRGGSRNVNFRSCFQEVLGIFVPEEVAIATFERMPMDKLNKISFIKIISAIEWYYVC